MLLADVRVVDLSSGIPGAYASKLLTDLGAEVIKVEEAEGDPLRRRNASFEVPYVVATVTLDEGWSMLSNVTGCPVDVVTSGMRVRVRFTAVTDEITLPMFEPVEEGAPRAAR